MLKGPSINIKNWFMVERFSESEDEQPTSQRTTPAPMTAPVVEENFSSEEIESEPETEPESARQMTSLRKASSRVKKATKKALMAESRRATICQVTELCCVKCLNSGIQAFGEGTRRIPRE